MQVETVTGRIAPAELGFCQCHEHIWIERGQSALVHPDLCIDHYHSSLRELQLYYAAGGRALVDAQPVGCGRNAQRLAALSRESQVHIIGSTGFHKMAFYPDNHWIFRWDADQLVHLFLQELQQGMYGLCDGGEPSDLTPHRAGQIKTALDAGPVTAQYEKLFAAATEAAKRTGAVVMVHVEAGSDPVALAARLLDTGVLPEQLVFCHMDRSVADLGVHKALCAQGIYLEYDTVARPKYHDSGREIAIIQEMLAAGFAQRLLLSLDVTRARLVSYGGEVGLCHILEEFAPLLHRSGVTDSQLHMLFHDNPAQVYAWA